MRKIKSPGRLISILYRKGQVYKNFYLKKHNITASEQPFLNALYHKDGVSQDLLCKYLYMDKASTARVIQSLIKKGFVTKEKDKNDKRINRIYLTEKGKNSQSDVFEVLDAWSAILTNNMTQEEKDLAYSCLERMVENVEEYIDEKKKEFNYK